MNLLTLRARGALRSLASRPVWLVAGSFLLAAVGYGIFYASRAAVVWLYDYPMVGSVAPSVAQRSLEALFLMLMAAVLFSVLIASIGTLYGSDDLELLLAHPTSAARVFGMKVVELFVNAAGLPLLFTLPVLVGVGAARGAPPVFYVVSSLAAVALYSLPVTLGALLALVMVRFSPAGRVREVATALSIGVAAAALLGFRALRPEQLLRFAGDGSEAFEAFAQAFSRLEIGWLPPAWATTASWAALAGELHASFAALLLMGGAGLTLTGLLARAAFARGWVRSLASSPLPRKRRERPMPRLERWLAARFGPVGALYVKDLRVFVRDVQQWSQLIVLGALAGVYFVSLTAMPVPTQQFRDVLGAMNIAFIGFIVAGVALRIAFPSVSLEGGAYWLLETQPISARHVVIEKFVFSLPIMLVLALGLGVAAGRVLDLSPALALGAPLAAGFGAVGLTGLAVGLGAANPHFSYTNPNEIVMTPGAFAYLGLALAYSTALTVLLARPAWLSLRSREVAASYWTSTEGLVLLLALAGLTLLVATVPLLHGMRQLNNYEGA